MEQSVKPCLRIAGLHIEGFKALRRVDWPADGMGWNGRVPDMVMVGGVNGSGKTTLLEFISSVAYAMVDWSRLPLAPELNGWVEFEVHSSVVVSPRFRVVMGDDRYVLEHTFADSIALSRHTHAYAPMAHGRTWSGTHELLSNLEAFARSDFPSVVYLPSDRRLSIPEEPFKAAGKLNGQAEFIHRFHAAEKWSESVEAQLYAARWADLNAKEQGRPELATHFKSYAETFKTFFQDTKELVWTVEGELKVKVAQGGVLHPLSELSSGEKQVLLFGAELYRHWRPGSLILIDEPELHFHPTWQAALWQMLEKWQKERGGQVIVTTQSNYLFGLAEPGTTVLLGGQL